MARPDKGWKRRTWRFKLDDSTILEVSAPRGASEKQVRRRGRASLILGALVAAMALTAVALASDVDVAVVDTTAPVGSITLAAGGSGVVAINLSVTGNQAGTATFNVYRDWTLSGGSFVGSNAETFTVPPRGAGDPATTFSTSGTVAVAAGQADGVFTLAVGAFDITNSNATGAKLAAGDTSNYSVTVSTPTPSDTTPPDSASVVIDDSANWTNDAGGAVVLDVSAHDAVGISRFRLATTQAGLNIATDVTVSPAEVDFNRNDVAFTLSAGDGAAKAVWARYCDAAGLCTDATDTIGLDTVDPVISGSTGAYAPGTWTNQDVVVSFICADTAGDANSGVATNTVAGSTLSASGADQSVTNTGACIDNAGNAAEPLTVVDIDIDKLAPSVTCGAAAFLLNQPSAMVSASVTDQAGLSGPLNAVESASADTTSPGSKSISLTGYDNAGNSTTVSCSYTVGYAFDGLFAPIDRPTAMNVSKAGQAIPLKWRLTDYFGNAVSNLTTVTVTVSTISCALGTTSDAVEEYAAGASGLQNLGDGYYQFNWKTPTSYAGSCKQLNLNLGDGAVRTNLALITFKK